MTLELALAAALGGLLGAPARLAVDRAVSGRLGSGLPFGTLVVNVSGSLVLGVLTGLSLGHHLDGSLAALLGDGFCGAFTTFSTFSLETLSLFEQGRTAAAAAYLVASLGAGVLAAGAGLLAGWSA